MSLLRLSCKRFLTMLGGKLCAVIVLLLCLLAYAVLGDILSEKASKTPCFALVDQDGSELSARVGASLADDEGLRLVTADAEEAERLLRLGRAEGIFTLEEGFGEALLQGEIQVAFKGAAGSRASEYGRSLLYASVLRERTYLQASKATDAASFDAAYALAQEAIGDVFSVQESDAGAETVGVGGVFEGVFARSLGVVILFISFLQLYMAQWAASDDAARVRERLLSKRGALMKERICTLLALFLGGVVLSVLAILLLPDLRVTGSLLLLLYSLVSAAVCLCIALYQKQNGKTDASIPLLALVSSLVGGCLFSLKELSPPLALASYFTPQGLALHLADGELFCLPLLLLVGVAAYALVRIKTHAR